MPHGTELHRYGSIAPWGFPIEDLLFNSLGVSISTVEKCDHLIENIRSCDQRRQRPGEIFPMGRCGLMMSVVNCLQCYEITGIQEELSHVP